jgi:hypothetical protein
MGEGANSGSDVTLNAFLIANLVGQTSHTHESLEEKRVRRGRILSGEEIGSSSSFRSNGTDFFNRVHRYGRLTAHFIDDALVIRAWPIEIPSNRPSDQRGKDDTQNPAVNPSRHFSPS